MQSFEENKHIMYQFVQSFGSVHQDQLIRYGKFRGMSGEYVLKHLLQNRRLFLKVNGTERIVSVKPRANPPDKDMRNALWVLLDVMSGRNVQAIMPTGDDMYLLSFVMEDEIYDICHVTRDNAKEYEKGTGSRFILVDSMQDINHIPIGGGEIFCMVRGDKGGVEYYERSYKR